jgi:urease accessory protein
MYALSNVEGLAQDDTTDNDYYLWEIHRWNYNLALTGILSSCGRGYNMMNTRLICSWFAVIAVAVYSGTAFAHIGEGDIGGGFISGFLHPVFGWDHVIAMVAVGLWGAFLGMPAMWLLPVVFPLVMAFGGVLGILGVPIPAVELGIAASAIVLGASVAFAARPPIWVAATIVGVFAIFHGHAHGAELPEAANALSYSIGFVLATGLLHLSGITFGLLVRWPAGRAAVRSSGAIISILGCIFLARAL